MKNTELKINTSVRQLEKDVRKMLGHLSLRFEGIDAESNSAERLKYLSNFLRSWKLPYAKLVIKEENTTKDNIDKLDSLLSDEKIIVDNLADLKADWNNVMILYDETAQIELYENICLIIQIYEDIYTLLLNTSNLIELYYNEADTKLRNEYNKQGVYFLHSKSDMLTYIHNKHTLTNENTLSDTTITATLEEYYMSLLKSGLYTLTIGDEDIEQYNMLLEKLFNFKLSDVIKTKVFFYIDTEELLLAKRKYIFDKEKYQSVLAEQVAKAYRIVISENEKITSNEIPHILNTLEQDLQFRYNNVNYTTIDKLTHFLNTYPKDTILFLENTIAKGNFPEIYEHILNIICDEINVPIEITDFDLEQALSYEMIPYKKLTFALLKQEFKEIDCVSLKTTYASRKAFYDIILEHYQSNKQRIVEEIEQDLYQSASSRLDTYATIVENIDYLPTTKYKYKKLAHALVTLKQEWAKENIELNFEEQQENTFRYLVEISHLGEAIVIDLNPHFIVDVINVAIVYNTTKELQELHQQTFSYINDNSELFSKVTKKLTQILMTI